MLARVVALLAFASALVAQEPLQVHADDPLHRFVELEVPADGATIEWTSDFDGTLHVWTQSVAGDPVLAVTVGGADAIADDDSGGGTTAYVAVDVAVGQVVVVAIQTIDRGQGATSVHWVASPETEETRAAVERAKELLAAVEAAQRAQAFESARALVADALDVLRSARGAALSHGIAQTAWECGSGAYRLGAIDAASAAWHLTLAARERTLPEDHPDLLRARQNLAITMHAQGELTGARALFERLLAARERTLPEDHPDLLAARGNLAASMKAQGDLAGARAL